MSVGHHAQLTFLFLKELCWQASDVIKVNISTSCTKPWPLSQWPSQCISWGALEYSQSELLVSQRGVCTNKGVCESGKNQLRAEAEMIIEARTETVSNYCVLCKLLITLVDIFQYVSRSDLVDHRKRKKYLAFMLLSHVSNNGNYCLHEVHIVLE